VFLGNKSDQKWSYLLIKLIKLSSRHWSGFVYLKFSPRNWYNWWRAITGHIRNAGQCWRFSFILNWALCAFCSVSLSVCPHPSPSSFVLVCACICRPSGRRSLASLASWILVFRIAVATRKQSAIKVTPEAKWVFSCCREGEGEVRGKKGKSGRESRFSSVFFPCSASGNLTFCAAH